MVDAEDVLTLIPTLTAICAIILALFGSMGCGRKLGDIEYQRARNINGIRWIQSWINLRVQIERVLLALAFLITSIMNLIDAPLLIRMWTSRAAFVCIIIIVMTFSVLDWLAELRQMHILIDEENKNGFAAARVRAHLVANRLQVAIGMVDLANNQIDNTETNLVDLKNVLLDVRDQFDLLQSTVRGMDPTYKIEKSVIPQEVLSERVIESKPTRPA